MQTRALILPCNYTRFLYSDYEIGAIFHPTSPPNANRYVSLRPRPTGAASALVLKGKSRVTLDQNGSVGRDPQSRGTSGGLWIRRGRRSTDRVFNTLCIEYPVDHLRQVHSFDLRHMRTSNAHVHIRFRLAQPLVILEINYSTKALAFQRNQTLGR
ncbi:hypothetical protein BC628DRAFT_800438 [Trametes gibbosa]|nr:hypothetical protein BC628DRAFT_800438 [Trametes gibbosa]